MKKITLQQALSLTLSLYLVATWTSMAGMEIFGWLTFLLVLLWSYLGQSEQKLRAVEVWRFYPSITCSLLLLVTVIGFAINDDPKAEWFDHIGSQRWMILLATHSVALANFFPGWKAYRFFLRVVSVIAAYAIFQSFTGIDLLRPGSNRAVQHLREGVYRSAGLYGSPMQWAYVAGQWACLTLAVALAKRRQRHDWRFSASALAFGLLAFSVMTTYVRGAWLASLVAWSIVVYLAAPRLTAWLAASATGLFALGVALFPQLRHRFVSLFDVGYASNSDRLLLWKANWQMFLDHPIFGIGYQENERRSGEYLANMGYPNAFTGHAHNNYLQMLSGTGLTGLATYLFLIGFMLWLTGRLIRRIPQRLVWPRALAIGAFGAQVHLHIGGLTECNFKTGVTSHNVMVLWGLVIAMSAAEAKGLLSSEWFNGEPTAAK